MQEKQAIVKKRIKYPGTGVSVYRAENTRVKIPENIKKGLHTRAKQWVMAQEKHEQLLKARGKSSEYVEARDAVFKKMAEKLGLVDELVALSRIEGQRVKESSKAASRARTTSKKGR